MTMKTMMMKIFKQEDKELSEPAAGRSEAPRTTVDNARPLAKIFDERYSDISDEKVDWKID